MRAPFAAGRPAAKARGRSHRRLRTSGLFAFVTALAPALAQALNFTEAPVPRLDLGNLGKIGIAGDFTGISLYEFEGQGRQSTNGSQSLLAQAPNGDLIPIVETDASIQAMCTFVRSNGDMQGVVIGGNFTGVDGTPSQGIALFDPDTSTVTPLAGLSGRVNALLCDQERDTVYVGGNFIGANSTNAIAWYGSEGWTNLLFEGFNGPVTSITKASNGNIIFGGSFTGLGNATAPSTPDDQQINLSTANISAVRTTSAAGFTDPSSIVCSGGQTGPGSEWLLEDGAFGAWEANFEFGFQPTKLRLWNTRQENRGTRTWRFTALPLDGILNMTYEDPETGNELSCTSECPLSNDPNVEFQDFHFVNVIGMDGFRIDISAFFGDGAGLSGIALYSDDIFAYAVDDFNEPSCAQLDFPSTVTATGPWTVSPSLDSNSQFLTAQLSGDIDEGSAFIDFFPDVKETGEYSVNIYTPGCIQDDSCSSRGQVNITGFMTQAAGGADFTSSIFQTNNFEKYDQIYFGNIDAATASFRPSVRLTPLAGQSLDNMTFVAQRIGFTLISSTGGLNGLFDFDPDVAEIIVDDFEDSVVNALGSTFNGNSAVSALATLGDVTYVAGNFTSNERRNIVAINTADENVLELDGGLNGEVVDMVINGTQLFVAGDFSNTIRTETEGLNNVAVYSISDDVWSPLGAGVDGKALHVVPMSLVLGAGDEAVNDTVIAYSGEFSRCLGFSGNAATPCPGFAIWVPSQSNWLQNLGVQAPRYSGYLTASLLDLEGADLLYAGSIISSQIGANGAVRLSEDGLGRFNVQINPPDQPAANDTTNSLARRDTVLEHNVSGILAGAFYEGADRSLTVLAGHFTAQSNGGEEVQNIALVEDGEETNVTGIGPSLDRESTFVTLAIQDDLLFAGGYVRGVVGDTEVVGFVSYDLALNGFNAQPPTLIPDNATVSSILVREGTGDVYFGGNFTEAGSLACPGVCTYRTSVSQWNRPGPNLEGSVKALIWAGANRLLAGGELTINQSTETFPLAAFDVNSQNWEPFPKSESLPGAVEIMTVGSGDGSQVWASGTAPDGSIYLMKYNGEDWVSITDRLDAETVIHSLQVFSLAEDHEGNDLLGSNQVLMLTGSIVLPGFGAVGAATFDGENFRPYALTASTNGSAGTIARIFTQRNDFFTSSSNRLALGFVVLIGLALSLALILLIVLAGICLDRIRKKRDGYSPAPMSMYDRSSGIQRIPPGELLQSLGKGRPGAPQV